MDRISYEETDTSLDKFLLSAKSIGCKIPSSFQEATGCESKDLWLKAIHEELSSLNQNNT